MSHFMKLIYALLFIVTLLSPHTVFANKNINIPILCYHNFNPSKPGSMNLRPDVFEAQLKWLSDNGFTVIPLKEAVAYLQGTRESLPPKSIVITVDDGWQSAYTYLMPIVRKYNIPVTLFIYPQTISSGKHAMTWDELREMQNTGLFDIQAHTYSHPNFKQERKHLSSAVYEKFVNSELLNARKILEEKMGTKVTLLAWPFGIYDPYVEQAAAKAGYDMAFSIDAKTANKSYDAMSQPRYMIVEGQSMKTFMRIVNGATK